MNEPLDFRYFGVVPDDLLLMRRIIVVLSEDCASQNEIVREADDLIESYARRWDARRDIRNFFEAGGLKRRIEAALLKRDLIESLAPKSEQCSLVLEFFREFETYLFQYEKTRAFIKKQRSLASGKRNNFFAQVAERDGNFCRFCQATEDLKLDHIQPVVLGGLSIMDNFQILCFQCNSKKGKDERAIQHPQAFYSIARNRVEALSYLQTAISYCESLAQSLSEVTPENIAEGHRILRALDKTIEELKRLKPFYASDLLVKEKVTRIKIGLEYNLPRIAKVPEGAKKAHAILQECTTMSDALLSA